MTFSSNALTADLDLRIPEYITRLSSIFTDTTSKSLSELAVALRDAWQEHRTVFICGNGGSAGNAIHLANDLLYGAGCSAQASVPGLSIESLSANAAVITCLANDVGYDSIYSAQLIAKAKPKDILIVLSGSGNSPNIIEAIKSAKNLQMTTYGILGFDGGQAFDILDHPIHFKTFDMQVAEDAQLISIHVIMQWLSRNHPIFP